MDLNAVLKRTVDILGATCGLVVLSPLFVGISVAIKRDSDGPVFFRQERLTKNGKSFTMLKFRSMYVNSEKQGTGLFNYRDDPRVTSIGRKLRDTSLDELPQLLNVLKGDLSLVGPRPPVSYELGDFETLNSRYKKRFQVRAGITGLAQVEGRNDIPWDEKVTYDNKYIDVFANQGILLDFKILFRTVVNVFTEKNIYEDKIDESMDDIESARIAEEETIRLAHMPD